MGLLCILYMSLFCDVICELVDIYVNVSVRNDQGLLGYFLPYLNLFLLPKG